MTSGCPLARPLLLCLVCSTALGFVLRKRSWADDEPTSLDDALAIIRLERQRLANQVQDGYNPPASDFYLGEPEVEDLEEEDEEEVDPSILRELFTDGGDENEDGDEASDDFPYLSNGEEEIQVDPKRTDTETPADMGELENILEDENEETENKRAVPYPFVPVKRADLSEEGEDTPAEQSDSEMEELSPSEVKDLLDEVDAVQAEELEKADEAAAGIEEAVKEAQEEAEEEEASDVEGTVEPVSEEELKSMFDDEDGKTESFSEQKTVHQVGPIAEVKHKVVQNGVPVVDEDKLEVNKELLNNYINNAAFKPTSKRKRSEKSIVSEEEQGAEIARAYIKRFLELEDDENTNLANALNLATIGQVRNTDKYINREAKFIRKAIRDEEIIQALKESVGEGESGVMKRAGDGEVEELPDVQLAEAEEEVAEREEKQEQLREYLEQKLQQYLIEAGLDEEEGARYDNMGEWLNSPVREQEDDASLNPFLRKIMEEYRANLVSKRGYQSPYDEENEVEDEDAVIPYESPVDEEEEAAEMEEEEEEGDPRSEVEVEDMLRDYIDNLSPTEQDELKEEVDKEIVQLVGETCPSFALLNDCAHVRYMGLSLDDEAMDLCNRHHLCYTCGAVHGMTPMTCDGGYLGEADELCEGQMNTEKCKNDAVNFFEVMSKLHPWLPARDAPPICEAQCTLEYIYGTNDK